MKPYDRQSHKLNMRYNIQFECYWCDSRVNETQIHLYDHDSDFDDTMSQDHLCSYCFFHFKDNEDDWCGPFCGCGGPVVIPWDTCPECGQCVNLTFLPHRKTDNSVCNKFIKYLVDRETIELVHAA